MPRTNFNLEDPTKQEKIRRSTHEYREGDGRHGQYVEVPYIHKEYPKQMLQLAAPVRKHFKSQEEFEAAKSEWDIDVSASIVRNEAEEKAWLRQHGTEEETEQAAAPAQPARRQTAAPKGKPKSKKLREAA